jgi:uncharacterized integral membrane protein
MIRKIAFAVILVPLAVVIVAICVANNAPVAVSLDPFSGSEPAVLLHPPLYILSLGLLIIGVLIGGFAAWNGQGRWRRSARAREAELRAARNEIDRLRRELAARETASAPPLALRPPAA